MFKLITDLGKLDNNRRVKDLLTKKRNFQFLVKFAYVQKYMGPCWGFYVSGDYSNV